VSTVGLSDVEDSACKLEIGLVPGIGSEGNVPVGGESAPVPALDEEGPAEQNEGEGTLVPDTDEEANPVVSGGDKKGCSVVPGGEVAVVAEPIEKVSSNALL
jgi:hypothetical protein